MLIGGSTSGDPERGRPNQTGRIVPADLGGVVMAANITREILEAYLHCKTKAHLKLAGQQGSVSDYEALLTSNRQEVRRQAWRLQGWRYRQAVPVL